MDAKAKPKIPEKKTIQVDEEWLDQLLQFEQERKYLRSWSICTSIESSWNCSNFFCFVNSFQRHQEFWHFIGCQAKEKARLQKDQREKERLFCLCCCFVQSKCSKLRRRTQVLETIWASKSKAQVLKWALSKPKVKKLINKRCTSQHIYLRQHFTLTGVSTNSP